MSKRRVLDELTREAQRLGLYDPPPVHLSRPSQGKGNLVNRRRGWKRCDRCATYGMPDEADGQRCGKCFAPYVQSDISPAGRIPMDDDRQDSP